MQVRHTARTRLVSGEVSIIASDAFRVEAAWISRRQTVKQHLGEGWWGTCLDFVRFPGARSEWARTEPHPLVGQVRFRHFRDLVFDWLGMVVLS